MKNYQIHKRALLIWLAIYPLITALSYLLGDYLLMLPIVLRTFILTVIAVPIVVYLILPFYTRLFSKWLDL
jgi:antibiotic biosynthesis monooxygenase (ABM) superfamily enzyme